MSTHWADARARSESDEWREYRRDERRQHALRFLRRAEQILALSDEGFDVEWIAENQFRIDGTLDLYPLHRRFHDLRTDTSGAYTDPMDIAGRLLSRVVVP